VLLKRRKGSTRESFVWLEMDRYFPGRFAVTVRPWDFGRRQRVRLLDDSVSVVLPELMTLREPFPPRVPDDAVPAIERSRRVFSAAYFWLPAGKLAGLHDLNCSALGRNRDHSKQAVCIIVWARCKE